MTTESREMSPTYEGGHPRQRWVGRGRDTEVMYKVRQSSDVISNRCSSARPVLPGRLLRTLMGHL